MKDIELFNDHFQNFKAYGIPKAQLIIADVPYNLGANAYASNPAWYVDGDNKNGESALAGKQFFDTDKDFRPAEFMHFCSQMLRKDKPIKEEKSEGGGKIERRCGLYDPFLSFRADTLLYRTRTTIWTETLHPARIPQGFLRAGTQSQHESRRQLRIRIDSLPRPPTEIQQ